MKFQQIKFPLPAYFEGYWQDENISIRMQLKYEKTLRFPLFLNQRRLLLKI